MMLVSINMLLLAIKILLVTLLVAINLVVGVHQHVS